MNVELSNLPDFRRGHAYRELAPREGRNRYRWMTLRKIRISMRGLAGHRVVIIFRDAKQQEWLRLDPFGILIAEGYAWNGCSPKRWLPLLGWCGTPDFPCTLLASLVHDALYQFHACRHFPDELTREAVDGIFREILERSGAEELGDIYHAAVRRFGSWSAHAGEGEYSEIQGS